MSGRLYTKTSFWSKYVSLNPQTHGRGGLYSIVSYLETLGTPIKQQRFANGVMSHYGKNSVGSSFTQKILKNVY